MSASSEPASAPTWEDVLGHLRRLPESFADVLSAFNTRLDAASALIATSQGPSDPGTLKAFLEVELPTVIEAVLSSPISDANVLQAQQLFNRTLEVLAAALRDPALADGPAVVSSFPLVHAVRVLVGGGQVAPRFPIPKMTAFGPGFDPRAAAGEPHQYQVPSNFFLEHGRPRLRSYQGRNLYIWPDNLNALRVPDDAIGWHVELLDPLGRRLPGGTPGVSRWVPAQVLGRSTLDGQKDEHLLRVAPPQPGAEPTELSLSLQQFDLAWLERGGAGSKAASNGLVPPGFSAAVAGEALDREAARLLHTACDAGAVLSAWLAASRGHVRAEVTAYDASTGRHTLLVDDGDGGSSGGGGGGVALDMVATRHAVVSRPRGWVQRPVAAQSPTTSLHQLRCVEAFGAAGGFEAVALRLAQTPAPTANEVLGAVAAVWEATRLVAPQRLAEVAWPLKEAVPRALLAVGSDDLRGVPREALADGVARVAALARNAAANAGPAAQVPATAASARAGDQLQLGIALKLFRCPQLEKRLQGLMVIRELVAIVSGAAAAAAAPQQQQQRAAAAAGAFTWATAAAAERWLVDGGFVEELFGGSCHAELVRRAEPVLLFLARRGALTAAHLEALWVCAEGRHEATARVLLALALGLVPALAPHLRLCLFSCAAATPFARYGPQTLQFVHDFTICALQAARAAQGAAAASAPTPTAAAAAPGAAADAASARLGGLDLSLTGEAAAAAEGLRRGQVVHCPERAWLGFGVLWQYVMGEPAGGDGGGSGGGGGIGARVAGAHSQLLSVELTEMAVELLVALLAEPEIAPERQPMINRCLENLHQRRSVTTSLMVLQRAIATLPASAARWFDKMTLRPAGGGGGGSGSAAKDAGTVAGMLEGLQRSGDLLGTLLEELEAYCDCIRRQYGGPGRRLASSTRVRVYARPTRFTHAQHLRARLGFLAFALTRSSLALTDAQLDSLWKCLIEEGANAEAVDVAMDWFQRACADPTAADENGAALPPASPAGLTDDGAPLPAALSPALRARLFTDKLSAIAAAPVVRPSEARLFLFLFLQINGRARAVRHERSLAASSNAAAAGASALTGAEDPDGDLGLGDAGGGGGSALKPLGGWSRQTVEMTGLETLWAMALDAQDGEVATVSGALLVDLHRRFGPRLAGARADRVREHFMQACLTRMAESVPPMLGEGAASKSVADSHRRRVRRCVQLLRTFLQWQQGGGGSGGGGGADGGSSGGAPVTLQVLCGPQAAPALEVVMPGSTTIADMRAEIARFFEEAPAQLELVRRTPQRPGASQSTAPAVWQPLDLAHTLDAAGLAPAAAVLVRRAVAADGDGSGAVAVGGALLSGGDAAQDLILIEDLSEGFAPDADPDTWDLLTPPLPRAGASIRVLRRNAARAFFPRAAASSAAAARRDVTALNAAAAADAAEPSPLATPTDGGSGGGAAGALPPRAQRRPRTMRVSSTASMSGRAAAGGGGDGGGGGGAKPPSKSPAAPPRAVAAGVSKARGPWHHQHHASSPGLNGDDAAAADAHGSPSVTSPYLGEIAGDEHGSGAAETPRIAAMLSLPPWLPPLPYKAGVLLAGVHPPAAAAASSSSSAPLSRPSSRPSLTALITLGASGRDTAAAAAAAAAAEADGGGSGGGVLPAMSAAHFDQLFAMLDLDVDSERGAGGAGAEEALGAAVWRVLQALPAHAGVVEDLRSLKRAGEPHGWSELLDPHSSYKLLYGLQIVDAFMTLPVNVGGRGDAALKWSLRFSLLGGVDHLCLCLAQVARQLVGGHKAAKTGDVAAAAAFALEPLALCAAYLCRALHLLFQLDTAYAQACAYESRWEVARQHHARLLQGGSGSAHAAGDKPEPLHASRALQAVAVAEAMTAVEALVRRAAPDAVLETAVCHGMSLITAAATATAAARAAVSQRRGLHSWLRALLLRASDPAVRRAAAGLLYRACEAERRCMEAADFTARRGSAAPGAAAAAAAAAAATGNNSSGKGGGAWGMKGSQADAPSPTNLCNTLLGALLPMFEGLRPWDINSNAQALVSGIVGNVGAGIGKGLGSTIAAPADIANASRGGVIVVPRGDMGEFIGLVGGLLHLRLMKLQGRHPGKTEARAAREAARRLATHHFSETLMSQAVDEPLVAILRMLLVLVRHSPALGRAACEEFAAARAAETGVAERSAAAAGGTSPSLLRFLYVECLFPAEAASFKTAQGNATNGGAHGSEEGFLLLGPKCKTEETRAAAFALAAQLVAHQQKEDGLLVDLLRLMGGRDLVQQSFIEGGSGAPSPEAPPSTATPQDTVAAAAAAIAATGSNGSGGSGGADPLAWKWDYDPAELVKSGGQHGGLTNQGATCYLNSVLQQLYHTRAFSGPLMGAAPARRPGREQDEELLFKLQVLFASLHVGQRRYHDTRPLCSSFLDYDGRPMSLAEQKDAYEFCSMLLDKLERSSDAARELVKANFGGTLQYQIVPREPGCAHTSTRDEPFLMLTAEVQTKDTLAAALDLFTAGEILDGDNKYLCEQCGRRVAAQRRCAIKDLPPTLIVHLKRFEFNLETMTRHKLNHRCAFPMTLDMEPWTVEGIEMREAHMTVRSRASTAINAAEELSAAAAAPLPPPLAAAAALSASNSGAAAALSASHRSSVSRRLSSRVSMGSLLESLGGEEGEGGGGRPRLATHGSFHHRLHPPDHYQYRLKGVVAHVGTADSGHYYSFIRVANGSWLEFNDRVVTPFNEALIPKECFGGPDPAAAAATPIGDAPPRLRTNSAYMLFYERVAAPSSGSGGGGGALAVPRGLHTHAAAGSVAPKRPSQLRGAVAVPGGADGDGGGGELTAEAQQQQQQELDALDAELGVGARVAEETALRDRAATSALRETALGAAEPLPRAAQRGRSNSFFEGGAGGGAAAGASAASGAAALSQSASGAAHSSSSIGGGSSAAPLYAAAQALRRRSEIGGPEEGGPGPAARASWRERCNSLGAPSDWAALAARPGSTSSDLELPVLSPALVQAVSAENVALLRDTHRFHPDFLRFVWAVVTAAAARPSAAAAALAAHVGLQIGVEVVLRARAAHLVPHWCRRLSSLAEAYRHAAENLLLAMASGIEEPDAAAAAPAGGPAWLWSALCACPHASSREAFADALCDALIAAETDAGGSTSGGGGAAQPQGDDAQQQQLAAAAAPELGAAARVLVAAMLRALAAAAARARAGARPVPAMTEAVRVLSAAAALGPHARAHMMRAGAMRAVVDAWTAVSTAQAAAAAAAASAPQAAAAAAAATPQRPAAAAPPAGSSGGSSSAPRPSPTPSGATTVSRSGSNASAYAAAVAAPVQVTPAEAAAQSAKELVSAVATFLGELAGDVPLDAGGAQLPPGAAASVLDSGLLAQAVRVAPDAAAALSVRLAWGRPINGPEAAGVAAALKDAAFAAASAPPGACAAALRPCMAVVTKLLHARDGFEAARADATLSWLVPCIDSVLERRFAAPGGARGGGGGGGIGADEADALQTVCALLLGVCARVPPARPKVEAHKMAWDGWAEAAAAAAPHAAAAAAAAAAAQSGPSRVASKFFR